MHIPVYAGVLISPAEMQKVVQYPIYLGLIHTVGMESLFSQVTWHDTRLIYKYQYS